METLFDIWNRLSGGDLPIGTPTWWQVSFRAALMFLAGLALVRWGKSRLLSRATALDVLLAFLLGSILSRAILGSAALSSALAASFTLIALHNLLSYLAMRSHLWGNLVKGRTYELVKDGRIVSENLRRAHLSEDDLFEALRLEANINRLDEVEAAYKERSGEIGVVKKPLPIQSLDIHVQEEVHLVRVSWSMAQTDSRRGELCGKSTWERNHGEDKTRPESTDN